ncbi:hypothetical protein KY289_002348 [Solanum tuberosum]|nr:hypothetical protein KY289_002348 [Solanum tuberosum]
MGVHLGGCSSSRNLFYSNEDFVGETVSERFSVSRCRFDGGDYGEEMQDPKRLCEEGGQIYFVRNSGQGGDLLGKEFEVAYKKDQVEQNELIVEIVESIRKGKLPFETGDDECDMYFCSNVCKFPYYSVDFGWGKPERVAVPNGPFKKMFFLFDYQTGQGVEARVMLQKQQMNEFECDEELLQFVL